MVSLDRLLEEFLEEIQIPSISGDEETFAKHMSEKLAQLGLQVERDSVGNVFACLEGDPTRLPLLFNAHLDTVPSGPVRFKLDNKWVCTQGDTILGADSKAGISIIMETLRSVIEENSPHGAIEVLLTMGEEAGLIGSQNFDLVRAKSDLFFVLDYPGEVGTYVQSAPHIGSLEFTFHGKAAHAGAEPEKGISAILAQAIAVSRMTLGRIDFESTANIGVVKGGVATNVIPDFCQIRGEVRSRNREKYDRLLTSMQYICGQVAEETGTRLETNTIREVPGYCLKEDDPILLLLKRAAALGNLQLKPEDTTGATDSNVFIARGKHSVSLARGSFQPHSFSERASIPEMAKLVFLLRSLLNCA